MVNCLHYLSNIAKNSPSVWLLNSCACDKHNLHYKFALFKFNFLFHLKAGLVDSNVAAAIPLTVFGIAAFLGGLLSLSLPETLDKKLPETIEDAHNLNR